MKYITLFFILSTNFLFAQNDVIFQVNHLLNQNSDFTFASKGKNNLGSNFTLSRMQYYLSNISIIHDGGQTLVFDDTTILVNAYNNTNINLGSHDVTNLESVKFHLGVPQNKNYLDPSTYPMEHPLSPKSPSMHWGWTSGYRFFAFEGEAHGQVFELHGVGDALYEEIQVNFSETSTDNGVLIIDINAEYNEALKDLDLAAGFSVHGDENDLEIVTGVANYKNDIFSANEGGNANSIREFNQLQEKFTIFPNPTNGFIFIDNEAYASFKVYDSIGSLIIEQTNNMKVINLKSKGIHFIYFFDDRSQIISVNKLIVL